MKKSKIRNQLVSKLLFSGYTWHDYHDDGGWYELELKDDWGQIVLAIHKTVTVHRSVRVYFRIPLLDCEYLAINKNTFNNIIEFVENEKTKNK